MRATSIVVAAVASLALLGACGEAPTPKAPPTAEAPAPAAPSLPKPPLEPEPPMTAVIGKPAPAFRLKDHTGKERSLADYKGSRVVLWFYPKASTGG